MSIILIIFVLRSIPPHPRAVFLALLTQLLPSSPSSLAPSTLDTARWGRGGCTVLFCTAQYRGGQLYCALHCSCSAHYITAALCGTQYSPVPSLAPRFLELPLPSWDSLGRAPALPSLPTAPPESDYPEDYPDLPSAIMNHFRTSTPAPAYPASRPRVSSVTVRPLGQAGPSLSSPPSGRVPYPPSRPPPSFLPPLIVPLKTLTARTKTYVSSSTLRPPSDTENMVAMLDTVKTLLGLSTTTVPPRIQKTKEVSRQPGVRTKEVSRLLGRVRGMLQGKKITPTTRRPAWPRRYPGNTINPLLPVTASPAPTPTPPCCLPSPAPTPALSSQLLMIPLLFLLHPFGPLSSIS